uniref:Uncharacterized protein n=1 Tax=Strigamia maritima TaxID=126957 RepID=T1J3Q3_STRMM
MNFFGSTDATKTTTAHLEEEPPLFEANRLKEGYFSVDKLFSINVIIHGGSTCTCAFAFAFESARTRNRIGGGLLARHTEWRMENIARRLHLSSVYLALIAKARHPDIQTSNNILNVADDIILNHDDNDAISRQRRHVSPTTPCLADDNDILR